MVTFTGPGGTTYTRHLLESNASLMEGLKVGDRADVTRTESVTFSVRDATVVQATPAGASRPTTSGIASRSLFSLAWTTRSSGNMIKAATGSTTGGVPINLNETKYDDVYGRMGMFRFGAAYRETPRTESVFNVIISRSSAQTVNVGTVGGTPLNVNFTDFNYWGVEGGQRVFFARTRFTPYVGFLFGINRNGDIRGTFAEPFPPQTPGLAAQDGKFFEKSWALSLGPTAGFLVGLGPIELMAETQLRWMNGLSDVDWLVEEGLRDINSESSAVVDPVHGRREDSVLTSRTTRRPITRRGPGDLPALRLVLIRGACAPRTPPHALSRAASPARSVRVPRSLRSLAASFPQRASRRFDSREGAEDERRLSNCTSRRLAS